MTSRLNLDAEALARHRNSDRWRESKANRPVEFRLDSEGSGLAVSLPAPATLAALLTFADADVYRRGTTFLTRPRNSDDEPQPIDLADLAESLREILATLPDRPDAGLPYEHLGRAASTPSPRFDAYLLGVLSALRSTLDAVPARPKALATALPPMTERERSQARRKAETDVATAAYEVWLTRWFPDAERRTYTLAELHRTALAALAEWQDAEDLDLPASLYVDTYEGDEYPGPRLLARVLNDRLPGTKKHTRNGTTYSLTKEVALMSPMTEAVIDRAAQMVAEEVRAEILARAGHEDRATLASVVPLCAA